MQHQLSTQHLVCSVLGLTTMRTLDDDACFQIHLGHSTDARRSRKVHVLSRGSRGSAQGFIDSNESKKGTYSRLDAPRTAQLLVTVLLPFCNQAVGGQKRRRREERARKGRRGISSYVPRVHR
jgi:hypothetical protein